MNINHSYFERLITSKVVELFNNFPAVILTGARQVGKSTLLEHTYPQIARVVFDPTMDVENARQDPELFLKNRQSPLILDEIQYAPELVPALKRRIDGDKTEGQYLLTGSQQWEVMKLLSESLAGRCAMLDLEGFCLSEISGVSEKGWLVKWLEGSGEIAAENFSRLKLPFSVYEQLWRGFFPDAQFLTQGVIPDFLSSYQRTYIERDVRLMSEVGDLQQFGRFFRLAAAMSAQEINFSQFGREIGVTPQTASRWLDILSATFQWFEIQAYSGNAIKRISNKPKGYVSDTGLMCLSQAIASPDSIGGHPLWGPIFETAVVNDMRRQVAAMNTKPNLYHWRSHGGAEVDMLLEWNGHFYPIEIKGKSSPTKGDARGIEAFKDTYPKLPVKAGLIVAPANSFYAVKEDIYVMPWDAQAGP
jgi:predicted AAA+ superfamily ATPase